ncbi:hypothetical protein FRAHR75_540050 [Frankia sp. Hr75.2]|nr:hypothetical protein FRAHR75_540050 [Frankia sp. Hr75.2]
MVTNSTASPAGSAASRAGSRLPSEAVRREVWSARSDPFPEGCRMTVPRGRTPRLFARGSWPEARRIVDILRQETVGGVLLLTAAVVALGRHLRVAAWPLGRARIAASGPHPGPVGLRRPARGLLLRGRAGAEIGVPRRGSA